MLLLVEKNIRGEIFRAIHQYAKAINRYAIKRLKAIKRL